MTEALVTYADGKLVPVTPADAEALDELEPGVTYRVKPAKAKGGRSWSQLALFWVMCSLLAENGPGDLTKEQVAHLLKIEGGHADVVKLANDSFARVARSIAFNRMSAEEFGRFLDGPGGAFDTAARLFGPALAEAVRGELDRMIAGEGGAGAKNSRAVAA